MAERFGRYWLQNKIGEGGMAEIFHATIGPDPETYNFDLAVKRLRPSLESDKAQVDMFLTESDVAKFLKHPNIIRVYESGLVDGLPYIAMEYMQGIDLRALLSKLRQEGKQLPTELAVLVSLRILRGLDYIHGARSPGGEHMEMVHRDVTPSNIYLTYRGEVKLGDFGVARVRFLEGFDEEMVLKGKPSYMPPEVLAGSPVSQGVDLWSLAVTLYEMVALGHPYSDFTDEDMVAGTFDPKITPAIKVNPDVDPRLSKILARSLRVKPRRRPRDAVAFYRALKKYVTETDTEVDERVLGQFLSATLGDSGADTGQGEAPITSLRSSLTSGVFETDEFAPVGRPMTQRIQIVQRRKSLGGIVVMLVALLTAAFAGWTFSGDDPEPRAPLFEKSPPTVAGVVVDPKKDEVSEVSEVRRARDPIGDMIERDPIGDMIERDPIGDVIDAETENPDIELGNAVSDFENARTLRFEELMHQGRQKSQRGRYDLAQKAYAQALKLKPGNINAAISQANAYFFLDKHRQAKKMVAEVLKREPKNARALLLRADLLIAKARDEKAKAAYRRVIKLAPGTVQARRAREVVTKW